MSTESIRQAIAATLQGIDGIGKVQSRERYAKTTTALKGFYAQGSKLKGGFVRRASRNRVSPDGGHTYVVTTNWEIHYLASFIDDDESEVEFDAMLDAIEQAFEEDQTLGGEVEATVTSQQAGVHVTSSQPAMFAGVLVHYAKLTLQTEHSEGD